MPDFGSDFAALTGSEPYPWQTRLYTRLAAGEVPPVLALCTGTGKTSIIPIYSLALAHGARIPRRLVYVVNRRVVVDQATAAAEKVESSGMIPGLQVSTMRGRLADNTAWVAHPTDPAVIVGTVDMIGSRLLFRGYRTGRSLRPIYAGLLGNDATIVLDEAHLEPAFDAALDAVKRHGADVRVVRMTATPRAAAATDSEPLELSPDDLAHPGLGVRLNATKHLSFESGSLVNDQGSLAKKALALKNSGLAILLFLDRVDDVQAAIHQLKRAGQQVAALTGTMRGLERDEMTRRDPIFARFLPNPDPGTKPAAGTVYLVATSAGEVGVDLSADHACMDVVPFERMIQRLGRVNRFGSNPGSRVVVFRGRPGGDRKTATIEALERLRGDASPRAVTSLVSSLTDEEKLACFSETPRIFPLSDITLDLWSLTTPGRHLVVPPIEPFLHGAEEYDPPYTTIAWRNEVLIDCVGPGILDDYPLRPHELAQDRSDRVLDHLHQALPETPVWLVGVDVVATTIGELQRDNIAWQTVVVPPGVAATWVGSDASDVADALDDRLRLETGLEDPPPALPDGMRVVRREEDETMVHWWLVRPVDRQIPAGSGQELDSHLAACERAATSIASGLPITDWERLAIIAASATHDLGKRRKVWQRAAGNDGSAPALAKPLGRMNPRALRRYRHELGSLIEIAESGALKDLDPYTRELATWLVAAHHGRARPHFPIGETLDPERSDAAGKDAAIDAMRLFGTLQPRIGRWRLAYLQAIRLAADIAGEKEDLA